MRRGVICDLPLLDPRDDNIPTVTTCAFSSANSKLPSSIGQIESNYDETVDSFDDMNLKSELLRGSK